MNLLEVSRKLSGVELAAAFTGNAVAGILKKISKSEALLLVRIDTL